MNNLVSVIIPVYKVEEYLNRCVKSVLAQTYRNLEVILVNDGSPDCCGEMCDGFAKIDRRVRVIHKKNGGLSDARNAGVEIASGEYLTFLDSDDWVHEEYIEKLYNLLISTESDIAACNFIRTSREDISLNTSNIEIHEFSNIEALEQLTGKFYVPLVVAWGKIYHKDLFRTIRYPVGKVHEDEYIAHHLLFKAKKVVFTTEQMLYYWQRKDSITGVGFNVSNRIYATHAIIERAAFLNEVGLTKLRNKTYKTAIYIYLQIVKYKKMNNELKNDQDLLSQFKILNLKLREGNYNSNLKIRYKLCCIMPDVMNIAFKMYYKAIKLIKGNVEKRSV
ncbi:glycosyltransferase family 2 protein [Pseudobacteroides cellulosolvens]|uniref:Glycosyl transferase family 2 n=1 Tax=Pseudobacteroides cellulosolvens ATCC 35603 = DSM 2933 TaxID=398512 RepID=A0A0L6JM48_9FIRM|nr:glycosyltransferase family 2 protein [Pseudobacteroides cellulosolvens]KNY26828.1 glycosyl transferase family 2 [Pseudobacteroides cellulosolvens ATCC 35603 = DSM 2933]